MEKNKGILLQVNISEKSFKKFLNHSPPTSVFNDKLPETKNFNKVIHFFTPLLYSCENNTRNVLLFNYDTEKELFFCGYILSYYQENSISGFAEILNLLSQFKDIQTVDYAVITSTAPDVDHGYQIEKNKCIKISKTQIKSEITALLLDLFWSFRTKNDFPEPGVALKKKNYYFKPFTTAYKKYIELQQLIEKPHKISIATQENPYLLFDQFYSFNEKVFELHSFFKGKYTEVPDADPYTFKKTGNALTDKNYVFLRKLMHNGPVNMQTFFGPNTAWEYFIIPGIDGKTFTYVADRWDTLFWKDKNGVYYESTDKGYPYYEKIEIADVNSFEYLGFCFAKDKNHVFYKDKVIDIDLDNYTVNKNGFIFDSNNIYHYENKLELDALTFKVLKYESETNPFLGNFLLEDKNGTYTYDQSSGLEKLS